MAGLQQLVIDQQLAEIGVNIMPAKMRISIPQMHMKITTEASQLEIDSKSPSFRVNRKKINNESGLKSPTEFTKGFRNEGISSALRGTKAAGQEGDFVGDARIRGNKFAKIARNKALTHAMRKKQLDLALMPKSSPEFAWDKGYMRINWSKHSIVIDWDGEYMPRLTVDPKYSVEVYLRKEPHFRVRVKDMVDPNSPGRIVDREI